MGSNQEGQFGVLCRQTLRWRFACTRLGDECFLSPKPEACRAGQREEVHGDARAKGAPATPTRALKLGRP